VYAVARLEVAWKETAVFEVFDSEHAAMEFVMQYITENEDYDGTE
jgi:hypothetical protein